MSQPDNQPADKPADTPPTPPPAPDPPTPPAPESPNDGLFRDVIERLEKVENQLQTVIDIKPDSSPVKKPWTHRAFGRKS
jgi:hypothetical protein